MARAILLLAALLVAAPAWGQTTSAECDAEATAGCWWPTLGQALSDVSGYAGQWTTQTRATPVQQLSSSTSSTRKTEAYMAEFTATHTFWLYVARTEGAYICIDVDTEDDDTSTKTGTAEIRLSSGLHSNGASWDSNEIDDLSVPIATLSSSLLCEFDLPRGWYALKLTDDATATEVITARIN